MRIIPPPSSPSTWAGDGRGYHRDNNAESLFRSQPVAEIRNVEAATKKQIQDKSEELRQLVGNRYRDLIDSADSIVLMKSSCESISSNISAIYAGILHSLSSIATATPSVSPNPNRARSYGIACRVKYLVDTPENIWGCLDETMFLEAAARYMRAKQVHHSLIHNEDNNYKNVLSNFPLLQHQWQIVESFKVQISQRSRERLLEHALDLEIGAYADALAAIAVIDELDPTLVLHLFLDSRKSHISQKLSGCSSSTATSSDVISVFCEVLKIIQVTVSQVGELYLQVLSDLPLYYKVILSSPPTSQLFGGIPNPDEEVRLWKVFRDKLESVMVVLDRDYISKTCSHWLKNCGKEIINKINGRYLIDAIDSGQQLAGAEKLIRETMEGKLVLEGSIEWLKRVFGSEIELPWKRTRELVLGDDSDLWDEIFEDAFAQRMKAIIESGFNKLNEAVNVSESIHAISDVSGDFQAYINRSLAGGGVWFLDPDSKKPGLVTGNKSQPEDTDFRSCLGAYFGTEVSRIRDEVDSCCKNILEDLLYVLESPKASSRLRILAPYLQNMCYKSIFITMNALENELENLYALLKNDRKETEAASQPAVIVERSLFIGRLLFAFQKHSIHVPVILGSPRLWVNESLAGTSKSVLKYPRTAIDSSLIDSRKKIIDSTKRKTSMATSAIFGLEDSSSPQLDELSRITQALCIRAHNLWITWVSDELSIILSHNLKQDDSLSATTSLRGWEETIVKQEQSGENESEMKILLPSMPSLYITSFLFQSCEEIDRIGGHVLDKIILQNFASRLLEKVMSIYGDLASAKEVNVSEKGVLQVLLDIRFASDVLSGSDLGGIDQISKTPKSKIQFRRKQDITKSVIRERLDGLINQFSQRLDPVDWLTYEPYLWESERQSYLRHAVIFGYFVQLNRMYTDTVKKLPTNSESNIMCCSSVPRFKYLPISAPALSTKSGTKASMSTSMDDVSSRSSWKSFSNQERSRTIDIDENSSFGVATPFLKSFMQVGSKFGESTLKFGSMLTDGQVGRFGDILPAQAAGLLSSFTATRSDS